MLFSSPSTLNSFANPTHNSFFFSNPSSHDESSNSTNSLLTHRNISNESTSVLLKGLNGSRPSQKSQYKKKVSQSPSSLSSTHYETGRSTEGSEVAEAEDLVSRFEESELDIVKKKLKVNSSNLHTDLLLDFNSRVSEMNKIFEEVDEHKFTVFDLEALIQAETDNNEYKFWANTQSLTPKEFNEEEYGMAVDLLNKKYAIKPVEKLAENRTVSYTFYTAPKLPLSSQVDHSDDEKTSPKSSKSEEDQKELNDGLTKSIEDVKVQSTQLELISKESQQILRESLKSVTESDIQRLEPEVYLNDNLLNFYLKLIEHGFLSEERKKKCHFFNTYFMAKMISLFAESDNDFSKFSNVYQKMEKWTKKVNIFEKDFLFVPVNEKEHWNLLVVCYPHRLFSADDELPFVVCLDSISRMDNKNVRMLFQFFLRELKAKMPQESIVATQKVRKFNLTTLPYFQQMLPKQSNSTDCGLYLLQYAEMFAEDESYILNDKQDMQKMRWFPKKSITEKRRDMRKIIDNLKAERFKVIGEYLHRRGRRISECEEKRNQFDYYNQTGFEQALARTYPNQTISDYERACLMLDYYYFGTLDFEQMAARSR